MSTDKRVVGEIAPNPQTGDFEIVPVATNANGQTQVPGAGDEGTVETIGAPVQNVNRPRTSPFRNHTNFVAGRVQIGDTVYDYGQLTDGLREWMEKRPAFLAKRLGVSLQAFQSDRYAADTPENRAANAKLPAEQRIELASEPEIDKLPAYFEETYDRVLDKCLVACDYPGVDFERDPEMKKELAMEVKAALVQQISRSSKFGLSQSGFLPQRTG